MLQSIIYAQHYICTCASVQESSKICAKHYICTCASVQESSKICCKALYMHMC